MKVMFIIGDVEVLIGIYNFFKTGVSDGLIID